MNKYYELFRKNFPFIVRNPEEALDIINNEDNKYIDYYDNDGNIVGTSIIYHDTILMLCVNEEYRRRGIGTKLLQESEEYITSKGYEKINIGVTDDNIYLMPGIPMATKPYEQSLEEDKIYENVNNESYEFFSKRGYTHSWNDNCFDMRVDLDSVNFGEKSIGDTIDGITYRFATVDDIPNIIKCTDNAEKDFSEFYKDPKYYDKDPKQKVLVATNGKDVCGCLMICIETEGKGLGSVGCTAVHNDYRGKHIAVNMVTLGTKYLKSLGLKDGYLGYTYSGLDHMYGYAGYKICVYYDMAQKNLNLNKNKIKNMIF